MPEYPDSATTGSDGDAVVDLSSGEYEFEVSADEHETGTVTASVEGDTSVSIELTHTPDDDPGATQDETVTDSEGAYDLFLVDGEYQHVAEHDHYWAEVSEVEIDGESVEYNIELEAYGDAVDTSELTEIESLLTDAYGEGEFDEVEEGTYTLQFERDGYRTKTRALDHDGDGSSVAAQLQADDVLDPPDETDPTDPDEPPAVGAPQGSDPGFDLPEGDAHFECAVLDTDAGADFQIPVLVSNTGGETGATDVRLELDTTGEVVTSRDMTLVSGGYAITSLSVRALPRLTGLPADVTVSTIHEEESFELTSAVDPREVVSPGVPTELGGHGLLGRHGSYTLGQEREAGLDTDSEYPESGWALTLERVNGDRRTIEAVMDDGADIEDTHTELASWSVETPADPSLQEWDIRTRAYLSRDGDLVTVGWCDGVDLDEDGSTATLSGTGTLGELVGDDHEVDISRIWDWRAGEYIVNQVAPEWSITVLEPVEPVMVEDESYSGSALDIITSFCQDYGLFFRPSQTHFREATIYEPGRVTTSIDLNPETWTEESSSEGYANEVVFEYAEGKTVSVDDPDEIRRLAEEQDMRLSDARETVRDGDDSVETESKAESRANAKLRERISNYERSGSMTMPARRLQPGVSHPMPTDDEVWHTARSTRLDGGQAHIELDPMTARRMDRSGGFALGLRTAWSESSDDEGRHLGIWSTGDDSIVHTTGQDLALGVRSEDGSEDVIDFFDERPDDDEWVLIHGDWAYDSSDDETVARAGYNGTAVSETTIDGAIRLGEVDDIAIGRFTEDYIVETIVESAWFWSSPQDATRYGRLADGGSAPATDLVSRFTFEEMPKESRVVDNVGGFHGERRGDWQPAGQPAMVESASHSLTETDAQFGQQVTMVDTLRDLS